MSVEVVAETGIDVRSEDLKMSFDRNMEVQVLTRMWL